MNEWTIHPSGETAVGPPVPVIADGDVFATVSTLWSDVDGVRVSIDWALDVFNGIEVLEDLSTGQATSLRLVVSRVRSLEKSRLVELAGGVAVGGVRRRDQLLQPEGSEVQGEVLREVG